jgi:carbamoyl-phosphate synthase large subunit
MAQFYRERGEDVDWMVVKYLGGDDYAWTSIWKDGELLTSVLKKRIKWVYNRIGVCACQVTVHNQEVNEYCESIIKALDPKLTGLMMVDMKQDLNDKKFYITEINSGRIGTTNAFFGLASREIYKDGRVNFPYILTQLCYIQPIPKGMKKFDALPEGMYYAHHLDMGCRMWRKTIRFK